MYICIGNAKCVCIFQGKLTVSSVCISRGIASVIYVRMYVCIENVQYIYIFV